MNIIFKIAQRLNRAKALREGYYDGRFRNRTIPDKKKNTYMKYRKNKKNIENNC